MLISIVNRSTSVKDEELQHVVRAINRQINEDFAPYWGFGGHLRLEGPTSTQASRLADLRGDAILYLMEEADASGALGYHDKNSRGIPYGFVFLELSRRLGENWCVTLSHEALELLADAQANLLAQGPHPEQRKLEVFHWVEVCDAVQSESYEIDGVEVSNFVLPSYYTPGEEDGRRNDFLGRLDANGKRLRSFGVKPGGYIGFFNPQTGQHEQWFPRTDTQAAKRQAEKAKVMGGRGYCRKRGKALAGREKVHQGVITQSTAAS